jgi:hypothetical protein
MSTGVQAFAAGGTLLSSSEVRVLGCLLEKQRTTPEQYPLSLNALRLACNQSTNRDPVVDYDDATLRDALHRLERRHLVRFASGSRAAKYRHLLEEVLPLEEGERAVLTVLLLRGPQTPGELKQRAERMHAFGDLAGVHDALEQLIGRELIGRLERRPGQKEERYEQLLQDAGDGEVAIAGHETAAAGDESQVIGIGAGGPLEPGAVESSPSESSELRQLRERVERLEWEVTELRVAMRNPSPSSLAAPANDPPSPDPRL